MVTDSLQNLEQYRGLHKNMDTVIDFLKKCDLTALPDGKTVIDGERVFVNVMEADLRLYSCRKNFTNQAAKTDHTHM